MSFSLASWLRPRPQSARPARTPARARLTVEAVEDRTVPSVTSAFAFGLTAEPEGAITSPNAVTTRIAVDVFGNAYVAGNFSGRIDFDPSDPSDAGDTLHSDTPGGQILNHTYKGFLAKYDPDGVFVWAHRFGNTVNDIATDAAGNAYAVGEFGTAPDDPTSDDFGDFALTAVGYEDVFVAKVAAGGTVAWAVRGGGDLASEPQDKGRGVAVDGAGGVYVCGSFGGTAQFGALPPLASGSGYPAAFAAKLNPTDGSFLWVAGTRYVSGSGQAGEYANAIGVDGAGRVSVTGEFRGSVDFDPGTGTTTLASVKRRGGFDSADGFVWQLDGGGNFRWARQVGGDVIDGGKDLAVDTAGNVYSVGSFEGTVDFDPGKGKSNLSGGGNYLLKFDAQGNFVWARGGSSVRIGSQLALDAAGNVYHTGFFSGTADFNPGAGVSTLTSAGGTDAFVVKIDPNGNLVWAVSAGGAGDDAAVGIAVDGAGNVWASGYFIGPADFGLGDPLTSSGRSAFVWKLRQA